MTASRIRQCFKSLCCPYAIAVGLDGRANIRRGEKLYISPFKDKANLQFDSSFAYEVPVLNNTATGLFNAMPSDTPRYSELQSILPAFERFEDVSPELLAKDSLLREFIGGGKYSY